MISWLNCASGSAAAQTSARLDSTLLHCAVIARTQIISPHSLPSAISLTSISTRKQSELKLAMSGLRPPSSDGVKVNSDQLAFLVHSDPSLPPEVDNPALARQKRRRTRYEEPKRFLDVRSGASTYASFRPNSDWMLSWLTQPCSPEDQAILEAEYQRNTKPDKATRAKIVERVALGDKEVQVDCPCLEQSKYIN